MITKHSSPLMISVLFVLCFSMNHNLSEGADSIAVNQSLSANQTIVSAAGIFEMGFFTPGNSSRYYVGIWYKNISQRTVVWVANRETPIADINSAELKISDGNLVLSDDTQVSIWSTNLNSTMSNSVIATLRDNGNLVLHDGSISNSNDEGFWQSFDYPVDTWLQGGKFGYDKRRRTKQLIISWKNSEDPSPGLFSFELDPIEKQYIIRWNRTEEYWTSGAWNGHIFSLMPESDRNDIYNLTYVDNVNESYFIYFFYNPSITRFTIDVSGQVKVTLWSESTKEWTLLWSRPIQCKVYAYCGAFSTCNQNTLPCFCLPGFTQKSVNDWNLRDYSSGCERDIDLQQCRNGSVVNRRQDSDRFLAKTQVSLPENSQNMSARTVGECESICLNNCSCTAYTYYGNRCLVWNGKLLNLQQLSDNDGNARTINIRLAASAPQFSKKKNNKGVVIGSVVGSLSTVMLLLVIVWFVIWRHMKLSVGTNKGEGSLVAFGYKALQVATKNFSHKLGGGGFGAVFKGILSDSTVIAVKKLQSISQGEKQFRTEVSTLGTIQHVNLVRLLGFCSQGNKKLLVYEYMKNGSLDAHLFNTEESNILDWKTRYQIMLGIARGLAYLHEKCRDCIIHCDIKPENILLDGEFNPKVADFGLAKLVGREFSQVLTTIRGTRGYLAPEWISGVAITAKVDVYSYGMMLFEFISGRRNSEQPKDGSDRFFPSFVANAIVEGGDIIEMLVPALDGNADVEEVGKICKVACWCIQDDENLRPSMGHVVQILEGVMDMSLPPIPRSMKLFVESQKHSYTGQSSQTKSDAPPTPSHSKSSSSTN